MSTYDWGELTHPNDSWVVHHQVPSSTLDFLQMISNDKPWRRFVLVARIDVWIIRIFKIPLVSHPDDHFHRDSKPWRIRMYAIYIYKYIYIYIHTYIYIYMVTIYSQLKNPQFYVCIGLTDPSQRQIDGSLEPPWRCCGDLPDVHPWLSYEVPWHPIWKIWVNPMSTMPR